MDVTMDLVCPRFKHKRQAVLVHIPHCERERKGYDLFGVNNLNPTGIHTSPEPHAVGVVAVVRVLCPLNVGHLRIVGVGKPVGVGGAVRGQKFKRHVLQRKRIGPIPPVGLLVGHPIRESVALRVEVRGLQRLGGRRSWEDHGRRQENAHREVHVPKVGNPPM